MATTDNSGNRLQRLKHSNYEIADGEPDIRGWDVKDAAGKTIGEVDELIFDVQSLKVRYMVVDLDDNDFDLDERDVLIPIGLGELHKSDDDVIVPGVTAEQLKALPTYQDDITTSDETNIRNTFAGIGAAGLGTAALTADNEPDFYAHEHFNEDNLTKNRREEVATSDNTMSIPIIEEEMQVGKKTVQTGGAYIKSRIVEKPVEETVNLQEERVFVERTPVDRLADTTDFDAFKEGTIELKEHAEVPVVSKEARVVEEITVGKEVTERDETIHDTVRKTEVDIENLGDMKHTTSATDLSGDL